MFLAMRREMRENFKYTGRGKKEIENGRNGMIYFGEIFLSWRVGEWIISDWIFKIAELLPLGYFYFESYRLTASKSETSIFIAYIT